MVDCDGNFINGFIERKSGGRMEGMISIEGIDLSPISAVMFKKENKNYLWIKRKDILEYDWERQCYKTRRREPYFEAYLEKMVNDNVVAYKGEFPFMMFRFSIVGIWDKVVGRDANRMNFFIERLPMDRQDIINGIYERRKNEQRRG